MIPTRFLWLTCFLWSTSQLLGQAGYPDSLFGNQGYQLVAGTEIFSPGVRQIYEQANGRLLMAGFGVFEGSSETDFLVVALLENGDLDEGFSAPPQIGEPGIARIYWGFNSYDFLVGVQQQSTGQLIIGGTGDVTNFLVVGRLEESGTLDPAFGDQGTGILGYPLTGLDNPNGNARAADLLVSADDRIVMLGQRNGLPAIMRLLPDGEGFDPSFNSVGWGSYLISPGSTNTTPEAIIAHPDGGYIACGSLINAEQEQLVFLFKTLENGNLDPSFGNNGSLTFGFPDFQATAKALAIQEDGSILVCGQRGNISGGTAVKAFVSRLLPQGAPDESFATNGIFLLDQEEEKLSYSAGIGVEADGRIVVGGSIRESGSFAYRPLAFRLLPDGMLDESYGIDGLAVLNGEVGGFVDHAILDQHDRFLLTGIFNNQFGVVRIFGGAETPNGLQKTSPQATSFAFPNPSLTGTIFFKDPFTGTLYDGAGRVLQQLTNATKLDLSNWSSGLFYLQDTSGQWQRIICLRQ